MRLWWVLLCGVLFGCAGTAERRRRTEAYRFDSGSAGCRQSPALCTAAAGEEAALPGMKAVKVVGTAAAVTAAVLRLFEEQRDALEEALEACADLARSKVLLEVFGGRSPTPEQCRTEVARDTQGRPVTWAMKLGTEMHKMAQDCALKKLGSMRPGGFSLEPRYRYNSRTGKWELVSEEEVRALLRDGRGGELRGTIVPDVVLHTGDPLQPLAVYDFKFPCVNPTSQPRWTVYPEGHAHAGRRQNEVYKDALKPAHGPMQIVPRLGTLP